MEQWGGLRLDCVRGVDVGIGQCVELYGGTGFTREQGGEGDGGAEPGQHDGRVLRDCRKDQHIGAEQSGTDRGGEPDAEWDGSGCDGIIGTKRYGSDSVRSDRMAERYQHIVQGCIRVGAQSTDLVDGWSGSGERDSGDELG